MLLSLLSATAPALADPPVTHGLICQFSTVVDPIAKPGTQSGQLSGGPVLLTEQDGLTLETGTLTCRVQVGEATHAGSGRDVIGHGRAGVFTAGPAVIDITGAGNVYLCSEFTDDSDDVTYYWNDETSDWSTDANTPCDLSIGNDGAAAR
jgi:hypothetical protein